MAADKAPDHSAAGVTPDGARVVRVSQTPPAEDVRIRTLLAYLGTAMTATGQPIDEVETDVRRVARRFGHPDAQIGAEPTGITVALGSGQPSTYESLKGPLRLDQSADLVLIRHQLEVGLIDAEEGIGRLLSLRGKPSRYPSWVRYPGWMAISAGITMILQPGAANVVAATLAGLLVSILVRLSEGRRLISTLLPTLAALVAGCLIFAAADVGLIEGPLRTLLPPLAVLLPGAMLVTGTAELAAGAMVAGTSRLVYATVQLLLFALGVVAAARITGTPMTQLGNFPVADLGPWAPVVGLLIIGLSICLLESVSPKLLVPILIVLVFSFAAQRFGQQFGGAALGPFLGAVAATLGARVAELIRPTLPRLVVFLPSFWLLVPGSLGLLGVSQFSLQSAQGAGSFAVVSVVSAIAVGLIVGAACARALSALVQRKRVRKPA